MNEPRTPAHRVRPSIAVILVGLTLAACRIEPPIEIPETTKVAGSDTRAALESYDPVGGTLRFVSGTPLLDQLEVGDVIVSEPSEEAPAGYLRKVEAVVREGDTVVVDTTQANLVDAITRGELKASGALTAQSVSSAVAHLPGVTVGPTGDLLPRVGTGEGYEFHLGFDEVALDIDAGDVQVAVTLSGEVHFNAGWSIDLGIEPCIAVPPVCVDRFEAKVGIDEHLDVTVEGEANAQMTKDFSVATYNFDPLVFFIGPVPVVVVPSIEVFVGAEGSVSLSFAFGVTETAHATAGARWTDRGGWQDITGFGVSLASQRAFDVEATTKAHAYTRADASLKFYGVAGPAVGLRLGAEFDAQVPRDPILIVRGTAAGDVAFLVDLPILGSLAEHRKRVFDERIELARSPNQPPRFTGVNTGTIDVDVATPVVLGPRGGSFQGYFDVTDPEGGPLQLTAVSSKDGKVPLTYAFPTTGARTVTVTATDARGATASAVLNVNVRAPAPLISTTYAGQPLVNVPFTIAGSAYDPVSGDLPCDAMTWSVSAPDVLTGSGCAVSARFMAEGQRQVTVSATTPHGGTDSVTMTFDVGPEPENKPPVITRFSIVAAQGPCEGGIYCEAPSGKNLWNEQGTRDPGDYVLPFFLYAEYTDDSGGPLTATWTCRGGNNTVPLEHVGGGTWRCDPYFPGYTIVVELVVSDGESQTVERREYNMPPVIR